jgi:transposase
VKHRHGHAPHDIRKSFAADGPENEDGPRPALVSAPSAASPELEDRPRRRTFTAADKLRILREIDRVGPGGAGGILRREGLYSSALTDWRRQRDAGAYEALKAVKRGPRCAPIDPVVVEHAQLVRDNKRLTLQLRRGEAVIDIQKRMARPVCKRFLRSDLVSLRQRIRVWMAPSLQVKTWRIGDIVACTRVSGL